MTEKPEFTSDEMLLATRVAKSAAWKWKRVDADEILSEMYWWMCKNFRWVKLYREQGDPGKYKLAAAMRRAAHAYAAGEQRERLGGRRKEDVQFYLRDEVTNALPFIFDFADWAQPLALQDVNTGEPVALPDSNVRGDAFAILSDVSAAYFGLSERDRHVINLRFKLDLPYKEMAGLLELTEDAARKRTDRAVDRLLSRLSGDTLSWNVNWTQNTYHARSSAHRKESAG